MLLVMNHMAFDFFSVQDHYETIISQKHRLCLHKCVYLHKWRIFL